MLLMIKYLKTHTIDDKWKIFKELNILEVMDMVHAIDLLHFNLNEDNINNVLQCEHDLRHAIQSLDDDDRYVLEYMTHRVLYTSYSVVYPYYNTWLFVQSRMKDINRQDVLEDISIILQNIERMIGEITTTSIEQDTFDADLKLLIEQYHNQLEDTLLVAEDMSESWVELIHDAISTRFNQLISKQEHYMENVFGQWLSELRISRGLSQKQVIEQTRIKLKYLQGIESGSIKIPTINVLQRLAVVYNIPVGTLASVAFDYVKPISEYLESSHYVWGGTDVVNDDRLMVARIFSRLESDDVVGAHQSMDELVEIDVY